jgi:hypothetical protein
MEATSAADVFVFVHLFGKESYENFVFKNLITGCLSMYP